ncbi:unnamed protein product [Fraxinus pennsylvanica]|uniref:FAF domain-containing protein n=1 Tax=Fraxinus pennsylvanica TaxID=56036 RepID=A0AAD1Z694_9LAMI|nr:unnamed protein product [Fraxinus pennsylvanica]
MPNPELDDYIGVESCVEMKTDLDTCRRPEYCLNNRRLIMHRDTADKIYPPPIPWPVRTGNFPSHMPWVMKRYSTSDGRLIIREEKVKRQEYFEAHSFNGRLVLNLIPFDDDEHAEDEVVVDDDDDQIHEIDGQHTKTEENLTEEKEAMVMKESDQCVGETGCSTYSSMEANHCGLAVAVPTCRPIHT